MTRQFVICKIFIVITFSIFLYCCATEPTENVQTKLSQYGDKKSIDITIIDYIEIKKHPLQQLENKDSISRRLTPELSNLFANKWNNAKSKGPCKMGVQYWLYIYLKDGTKRTFRANGQTIKENNDWCLDIGETDYFKKLWTDLK